MSGETIVKIAITIATFLLTVLIPTAITMIAKIKAAKAAKNEAERQVILNEISADAQTFIINAEKLYKDVDGILKSNGKSCGAVKKDSVMTKIQAECLEKGITFDAIYWSEKIDDLVAMTKKVN